MRPNFIFNHFAALACVEKGTNVLSVVVGESENVGAATDFWKTGVFLLVSPRRGAALFFFRPFPDSLFSLCAYSSAVSAARRSQ